MDNVQEVCNGADGLNTLVILSLEPAGENCAQGGIRVDSGLDLDRDTILDTKEIDGTFFLWESDCTDMDGDKYPGAHPNGGVSGIAGCTDNTDCAPTGYCEKSAGDCLGTGLCGSMPTACTSIYNPVCGCDGLTYGNSCYAAQAGVSISALGECP